MWSSGTPDDTVGASEAREVAWCTKPGHGTRIIPPGTITGAQWLYAKSYVMVVGFLNQANVNLDPTDEGGGKFESDVYALQNHTHRLLQNSTHMAPTSKVTRSEALSFPMDTDKTLRVSSPRSPLTRLSRQAIHRSLNGSTSSVAESSV